jgi:hypothetical protein
MVEQTGTDLQVDKITNMPFASKISLATKKGAPVDSIPDDVQWTLAETLHASQEWYPETKQITGINATVVFQASYNDGDGELLYRVDNYDYTALNPTLYTDPTLNGFTYLYSGDGIIVGQNEYVTLTIGYVGSSATAVEVGWLILDYPGLNLVYTMPYSSMFAIGELPSH